MYEFLNAGKAVFHFGDRGDKFYIVLEGQAGVFLPKSNDQLSREPANELKKTIPRDEKGFR